MWNDLWDGEQAMVDEGKLWLISIKEWAFFMARR
jgi:hypothetical protein